MPFKTGLSAAALASALALSAAAAQQVTPPTATEAPKTALAGQIMTQPEGSILARDLIGQSVTAPDASKIGKISDLLLGKDGRTVEGFVIGVGGFLGMGERRIALKMDQLRITPQQDGGVTLAADFNRDDLANAPAFKSKRDIEADKRAVERPVTPGTGRQPTQ